LLYKKSKGEKWNVYNISRNFWELTILSLLPLSLLTFNSATIRTVRNVAFARCKLRAAGSRETQCNFPTVTIRCAKHRTRILSEGIATWQIRNIWWMSDIRTRAKMKALKKTNKQRVSFLDHNFMLEWHKRTFFIHTHIFTFLIRYYIFLIR